MARLHPAEAVAAELEAIACRLPTSKKGYSNPSADAARDAYFESAKKIREAFTQPVPGNSGGVDEGLENLWNALCEAGVINCEEVEADPQEMVEAIHEYAASTQPPSPQADQLRELLKAVEPFTVDGGVGCGTEEVDALVETYERIVGELGSPSPQAEVQEEGS